MKKAGAVLLASEGALAVAAMAAMSLLPVAELLSRQLGLSGVPGSSVFVQHLTLWVALLGAALAAGSDRFLSVSANTFLPEKWLPRVKLLTSFVTAAVALCLAWASLQFVLETRQGGDMLAMGIPKWVAQAIMPAGFLLIAARVVWRASDIARWRVVAALGLLVPVALALGPAPQGNAWLWAGIPLLAACSLLGLPIFATLGGIGLLLFWNGGMPVAGVPVQTYSLVASPVLPSLPLFTLAGYLLVEGGAAARLLRVYSALFGWLPGGLAITTAVACAIFTFAGSGLTIVSMGGLLLPMLLEARYRERFSIGLINASGSLGLLFPPSVPVILYGMYAMVPIDTLFYAGFVPGLLMVAMVCAWGVFRGVRDGAARARFSLAEARGAIWDAKWELLLPMIVLVGIFGGFGTLTEAGAITVVYTFLVECMVSPTFSPRRFASVATECVTVIGGVLLIVGVAVGFTNYLVMAHVPELMKQWALTNIHSKIVFLLLLNVVLLVKGSFMDVFSAIIVLVPLLKPIADTFGIDPVQLGIIFLANGELGYLTPPVGMNLCYAAYRFQRPMTAVYRATLPFYLILLVGVLLITYVPALTLWPLKLFGE